MSFLVANAAPIYQWRHAVACSNGDLALYRIDVAVSQTTPGDNWLVVVELQDEP
jgi:hypothetical protein